MFKIFSPFSNFLEKIVAHPYHLFFFSNCIFFIKIAKIILISTLQKLKLKTNFIFKKVCKSYKSVRLNLKDVEEQNLVLVFL